MGGARTSHAPRGGIPGRRRDVAVLRLLRARPPRPRVPPGREGDHVARLSRPPSERPASARPAGGGGGQDEPAAAPGRHRHRQGAKRPAGLQRDVLAPRQQREGPAHHAGEQPLRRGREQLYPSVLEDIEELHETE